MARQNRPWGSRRVRRATGAVLAIIVVAGLALLLFGVPSCSSPDRGPDAASIPISPERPTRLVEVSSLLGQSLSRVEDEIGKPSIDNTLPKNLAEKAPTVQAIPAGNRIAGVPKDRLIVTAICIDLASSRIAYGVVPEDRMTSAIASDLQIGGLKQSYDLKKASGCGKTSMMSAIAVFADQ